MSNEFKSAGIWVPVSERRPRGKGVFFCRTENGGMVVDRHYVTGWERELDEGEVSPVAFWLDESTQPETINGEDVLVVIKEQDYYKKQCDKLITVLAIIQANTKRKTVAWTTATRAMDEYIGIRQPSPTPQAKMEGHELDLKAVQESGGLRGDDKEREIEITKGISAFEHFVDAFTSKPSPQEPVIDLQLVKDGGGPIDQKPSIQPESCIGDAILEAAKVFMKSEKERGRIAHFNLTDFVGGVHFGLEYANQFKH